MRTQKDLEERIVMHNEAYREGTPIVSDERYDELLTELKFLYPDSYLLKKGVIENKPSSRKEALPTRMASLDKHKNLSDIVKWLRLKGIDDEDLIIITPKFDGISLVDQYENCWTRGDGFIGQVSNKHFTQINTLLLDYSREIYYGEAIISKANWGQYFEDKVNPRSKEPYKNARNTTAGLFNNDNVTNELQYVDYIRYGIADSPLSKYEQLKELNQINMVNCKIATIKFKRLEVMCKQDFTDLYNSWNKDYAIDGLVFDIDNAELRKSLGREENGNPAYARALKLPEWNDNYDTKITGHKFQISKQGKLKGTVQFPTINIDGVDVTQATFYNAKFLFDWGLAKGRNITIKRSGDVIPKIVSVEGIHVPLREEFKTGKEYDAACELANEEIILKCSEDENFADLADTLALCPCCGEPLKWDSNMVEMVCTNTDFCKDIKTAKLVHFFKTLEFEDFGEESIRMFYDKGFKFILDYFPLTKKSISFDEISNFEGWGEKTAQKLINQLDKLMVEGVSLAKLLTAFDVWEGILGEKDCQNILDNIVEDNDLLEIPNASELIKINGIGEITANAFIKGLSFWEKNFFDLPINVTYFESPKQANTGNECSDWYVCQTGFRSDEITAYIALNGGTIVSGVSKKTTHLIVKDKNSTSSKMKKAQDLGCEILSKEEFETKYL